MKGLLSRQRDKIEYLESIDVAFITIPRNVILSMNNILFVIEAIIIAGFVIFSYFGFAIALPTLILWGAYFAYVRKFWKKFRYSTGSLLLINLAFSLLAIYPIMWVVNYLKELIF